MKILDKIMGWQQFDSYYEFKCPKCGNSNLWYRECIFNDIKSIDKCRNCGHKEIRDNRIHAGW